MTAWVQLKKRTLPALWPVVLWLYHPMWFKEKSPKLQPSLKGPYRVVTQIKDVVYRIRLHPRTRIMVVHIDWLAPYKGTATNVQC
jgi:hypothetical protein